MLIDIRQAIYKFNTAGYFGQWLYFLGALLALFANLLIIAGLIDATNYASALIQPKTDVWLPDGNANMVQHYVRPDGTSVKLEVKRLGAKWLGRVVEDGAIISTVVQPEASLAGRYAEMIACTRYWKKDADACYAVATERLQ